jgi:hypothetical protein
VSTTLTSSQLSARTQFRRVNPYAGLMLDADVWRDAHEYHRDQIRLHHLALHGWGIVQGLELSLVPGSDNTIRIEPGIAIDSGGNFIVVTQAQTYHLMSREQGIVYLVLQFSEILGEPATSGAGKGLPTRIVEAYRIQERDRLPTDPYIELMRVDLNPSDGAIRYPSDPSVPVRNEIDQRTAMHLHLPGGTPTAEQLAQSPTPAVDTWTPRINALAAQLDSFVKQADGAGNGEHNGAPTVGAQELAELRGTVQALQSRADTLASSLAANEATTASMASAFANLSPPEPVQAAPAPQPLMPDKLQLHVAVGEHNGSGWDRHRDGLRLLCRELSIASDLSISASDPVPVGSHTPLDLVYLSGIGALTLSDTEVQAIGDYLDRGVVVLGEGCGDGPAGDSGAREFAMSFVDLASRLGRQLTRVDRDHPLMTSRFVFGEPPQGARATPRLLESGGLVYSDADYGCAWQGGTRAQALARGAIRDAVEFGANVLLFRRTASATQR